MAFRRGQPQQPWLANHHIQAVLPLKCFPPSLPPAPQDLGLEAQQARKLLSKSPWVLGLDAERGARPVLECLRHIVELSNDQVGGLEWVGVNWDEWGWVGGQAGWGCGWACGRLAGLVHNCELVGD